MLDEHDDDWLDAFRCSLGNGLDRPLVVLSLFDGIGGVWAALERLRVAYVGYSCEINPYAQEVVKVRYPTVQSLGDIRDIRRGDIEEEIDLIVGGFPCQDLTSMGKRIGLHGSRSCLFFDMLKLLHAFRPKWFLVENVASMTWVDRFEISKYLGCYPIEIDSEELTVSKRRRLYWTNIPHPKMPQVRNHKSNLLQSVLEDATALEEKVGCVMTCNYYVGGFGQLQPVVDNKDNGLRYIKETELEKIMGFPAGHTDVEFSALDTSDWQPEESFRTKNAKAIRWGLLGNSFSVQVIAYMLSPLLQSLTWKAHKVHRFSRKFKEKECSVMETGEVWALYNDRAQPGWYAIILDRTGDRFDLSQKKLKRKRPRIHVRFLELDAAYLAAEVDEWNPLRGTGLYVPTDTEDVQESFLTFSHSMNTFKKIGDAYFIYPGVDEVWAVYDRRLHKPKIYYVYIKEVDIDWSKVGRKKPRHEGFLARCKLMQQTSDIELFRLTGTEVTHTDLSQFCFKVPYYFKGEANVFRLELSPRRRSETRQSRRKRKAEAEEEDDEEVSS